MSLSPKNVTLAVAENATGLSQVFTLTEGNGTVDDSTVVEITVSHKDLQSIKALPPLGQEIKNTFISIAELSVKDMAGNRVNAVPISDGLQVRNHTSDLIPPTLRRYAFDLNTGQLHLTFSEEMILQTFVPNRFTLQSASSSGTTFSITSGNYSLINGTIVILQLFENDLNEIKKLTDLATKRTNTHLVMEKDAMRDLADNEVSPILSSRAARPRVYTPDTTRPYLLSFDLNLNSKLVTMRFSEAMNATSLSPQYISFQNRESSPSQDYTLTGGASNSSDGLVLQFTLTFLDKNELKKRIELATGKRQHVFEND